MIRDMVENMHYRNMCLHVPIIIIQHIIRPVQNVIACHSYLLTVSTMSPKAFQDPSMFVDGVLISEAPGFPILMDAYVLMKTANK